MKGILQILLLLSATLLLGLAVCGIINHILHKFAGGEFVLTKGFVQLSAKMILLLLISGVALLICFLLSLKKSRQMQPVSNTQQKSDDDL